MDKCFYSFCLGELSCVNLSQPIIIIIMAHLNVSMPAQQLERQKTTQCQHSDHPDLQQTSILRILCESSCAWPDSNMSMLLLISPTSSPPSTPSSQIPSTAPFTPHPTYPCCCPTTSILSPLTPLPADGEHELTSDDGSTLSQSLSVTQSPQSTPAKEGITHNDWLFRVDITALLLSICMGFNQVYAHLIMGKNYGGCEVQTK